MFSWIKSIFRKFSIAGTVLILMAAKLLLYIAIYAVLRIFGATLHVSFEMPTLARVVAYCLFPAVTETFVAQYLVIDVLGKYIRSERNIVLLSATLFALIHIQSIFYVLYEFPFGIFYALAYLVFREKTRYPYLYVGLIHLLWNFFMLVT